MSGSDKVQLEFAEGYEPPLDIEALIARKKLAGESAEVLLLTRVAVASSEQNHDLVIHLTNDRSKLKGAASVARDIRFQSILARGQQDEILVELLQLRRESAGEQEKTRSLSLHIAKNHYIQQNHLALKDTLLQIRGVNDVTQRVFSSDNEEAERLALEAVILNIEGMLRGATQLANACLAILPLHIEAHTVRFKSLRTLASWGPLFNDRKTNVQ